MLSQAAWEFDQVEEMIRTAEKLFGDYRWDRFDLLCMPPSFPYGGMENPRLTFLTPTLLAGDRSLVNVVVHELAHSWTGNLVTNANMEHFWLNEGFTVYAERRILEALEGADHMALHAAVGRNGLQRELQRFGEGSPYTRLRTELEGVDPDDVFSLVPYEKGFLFVRLLHETAGEERFDAFLRTYIERFAFSTLTTEQFTDFVQEQLPGVLDQVDAEAWLYQPGLPENEPTFRSPAKEAVEDLAAGWSDGARPRPAQAAHWRPEQWLIYLEALPGAVDPGDCAELDEAFGLTDQGNAEILVAWLRLAVRSGYSPAVERALALVGEVGRMKFLKPLYAALAERPETRQRARARFEELQQTYHPIARQVVRNLLAEAETKAEGSEQIAG
jgi:aminopeptidase N